MAIGNIFFECCYLDNYAETSCGFLNETTLDLEVNDYNYSINLTLETDCSHDEFSYYSFKEKAQRPLKKFESAADQNISYTRLTESQNNTLCTYLISIQMTKDLDDHLKGVIVISTLNDMSDCHPKPLMYNITAQAKCDCNPGTKQHATIISDQETTTSSSCKVIMERILQLFCSLICLIFVKV